MHGPQVDQVLVDEVFTAGGQSDEVLWLLADHQGTIRDIVDDNLTVRKHVEYDSFGQITGEEFYAENGTPITSTHAEAVDQLFYYTGQERDSATGLQKHGDDPGRWYDPRIGRWLSEDPIGFDAGDPNLYRYAENDPVNNTDPSGRSVPVPTDYLPALSRTPQSRIPTADESLRQLNAPRSFDYYSDLAFGATRPAPTPLPPGGISLESIRSGALRREQEAANRQALEDRIRLTTSPAEAFLGRFVLDTTDAIHNSNPIVAQLNALGTLTDPNASTTQKVVDTGFALLDNLLFGRASGLRGATRQAERVVDALEGRGLARTPRQQLAFDYKDSRIGAASDVATRRRIVPALQYNNPNPRGSSLVRFDAVDPVNPNVLIDRKLNVTTHSGQLEQLRRQARALEQNPGYRLRIEVPNEQVARAANKALDAAGVRGAPITVKVVPSR